MKLEQTTEGRILMFEHINEVVQEASIATCDAILDYIHKCETYNDFETSKDFNEYVQESMMYFMEAVSKDKDEITKWMVKKGYFYTGNNPKKKKECLRMYHLLKQHDFRPSDGTYLSDINDGNGGKKRIKLNIDGELWTDEYSKRLKYLSLKDEENLNEHEKKEYQRLKDEYKMIGLIKRGENAYFTPTRDDITMGSKTMKKKQFSSQTTLKHEEGHADSFSRRKDSFAANNPQNLPEDHPAKVALKEHKESGKYVNSHDDSTEELMADAYAAQHSKIRNKHRGSKNAKGLRNITKAEVKRSLNGLSAKMGGVEKVVNEMKKQNEKKLKEADENIDALRNMNVDEINTNSPEMFYDSLFKTIKKIGYKHGLFTAFLGDVKDDNYKEIMNNIQFSFFDDDDIDFIKKISDDLKAYKAFQKALITDDDDLFNECIKKYPVIWDDIQRYGTHSVKDEITKLEKRLKSKKDVKSIKEAIVKKEMFLRFDNYMKHDQKDKARSMLTEFVDPIIKHLERIKNTALRVINNTEQCLKETHGLRADFASNYIKEYFEEFINNYIYND